MLAERDGVEVGRGGRPRKAAVARKLAHLGVVLDWRKIIARTVDQAKTGCGEP